ncbi:hypothetical protein BDM02DRAFT_2041445 [Thelephora ganbajun]|uniref:Uncharacterized protein n=1 Tax=Thelephora ganbajun TaxID=370292 RepID=A0ACB6ZHQ9_THEGA|nr:hypothetical protein BDM02DRAFT_2041445 [Thelephora ganbajun]
MRPYSPLSRPRRLPVNAMQPILPQDVIDVLVDWVSVSSVGQRDPHLRSCSLVARSWVQRSRQHLFYSVELASTSDISNWIENVRPGVGGVSGYVRKLWMNCNWDQWSQRFSSVEHLRSFTRVEELRLTYWRGGQATKEEVEEAFGGFGPSVRTLSISLPRGDPGSFLHLLSLFPHLNNLSIWTSCLDESLNPLPRNLVTVHGRLALDCVQEHLVDALIGSGLKPKALKISIPHLISYDGLLTACASSVEVISLSPTYGACLDHTSLTGFTALRHVEIGLLHPTCFFADVHTILRPVPSPHLERVTFNFLQKIRQADFEGPGAADTWMNADDVLYDLSTRRPERRLLLVIKGVFDSTPPIDDLVGTMTSLLPRFMDIGMVETEASADVAQWPEHEP